MAQPSDREDIEGNPFVGRTGWVLDAVMPEVGIDRAKVFATVHPSYLLRMPDRAKVAQERKAFARNLDAVGHYMETIKGGSMALDRDNAAP